MTPAEFSANLRAEMGRQGTNPTDLCTLLREKDPHAAMRLRNFLAKQAVPTPPEVSAIAAVLGCPVERLTVSREELERKLDQLEYAASKAGQDQDRAEASRDHCSQQLVEAEDARDALKVRVAELERALAKKQGEANVLKALFVESEKEMQSDDPVEVRLRRDLDDADEHAKTLGARVAELEAEALRYYRADGSYEVMDSAEDAIARRKGAAVFLAQMAKQQEPRAAVHHQEAFGEILAAHGWGQMPAGHEGITWYTELPRVDVQTELMFLTVEYMPYADHVHWYFTEGSVEGTFDYGDTSWALQSAIALCAKDALEDIAAEREASL